MLGTHPLAGKTVILKNGQRFVVEDWWQNISGKSWQDCDGNVLCLHYAIRAGSAGITLDDEVIYGKIDGEDCLVHSSELETSQ
jgi:hypothetical protein